MDRSFRTTPRSMRVLTLSSSFLRTILLGFFFVALFELGTEQDKLNCFEFGGWMEINKGFMFHVVLCEDDKNCKGWLGTTISIIARTLRSMISSEPIRTFLPTDAFFDK